MQLLNVKTARFADVVKKAGTPEVLTLWSDPRNDKEFQRAVRAHRVITVHQTVVGAKKDFGEVGFHPGANVAYWLFPKSLEEFEGRRIVGIDYDLLPREVETGTASAKKKSAKPAREPRRPPSGVVPRIVALPAPDDQETAREKVARKKTAKKELPKPTEPEPESVDPPMRAAIDQAKKSLAEGGIPIGAALVRGKKVIATGHNKRVQDNDPVTHAETDCLRNAGRLGSFRGCTLYSTLMPCYFCAGAAVQFGIKKVIVGEKRNFAGASEFMRAHGIEVIDCDLRECREMLASFIRTHRKLWNEDIGA
jgi:cytosine deaminase